MLKKQTKRCIALGMSLSIFLSFATFSGATQSEENPEIVENQGSQLMSLESSTTESAITIGLATTESAIAVNRFTAGNPVDIFAPVLDNGEAGDHTHGSGIVKLPDGEMLSVWFQGNGERKATTTKIMASRLPVGATEWTTPFVMADAPGVADINPTVYVDTYGKLWMFWYPVLSGTWETSQPRFAYADVGRYEYTVVGNSVPKWNWSDTIPIKIGKNIGNTVATSDKFVLDIKAGSQAVTNYLYSPIYVPQAGDDVGMIYEDLDSGAGVNQFIRGDDITSHLAEVLKKIGGDPTAQLFTPTVADKIHPVNGVVQRSGYPLLRRIGWQTKNKPLEVTVRAGSMLSNNTLAIGVEKRMLIPLYSDGLGVTIMAITDDSGKTWMMSDPIVGADNIQASMLQRANGDIVAFMRDNGPSPQRVQYAISKDDGYTWSIAKDRQDLFDYGIGHDLAKLPTGEWVFISNGNQDGRYTLSAALSADEGKTWKWRRHIELDSRDDRGDYHYPAVIADADGNIHITYTVDYAFGDKGAGDISIDGYNNIKYVKIDKEWIKAGDWSDSDTTLKTIFSYELREVEVTLPADFDSTKEADGKFKMSEIEKVINLLPKTVKGYITYNNHGELGLQMAAPEYVEIPVTVNAEMMRNLLTEENVILDDDQVVFTVDVSNLPAGITADMLPAKAPTIYTLGVHK